MNQQIEDKIVLRVLARFNERSQVGINKYNTTLERSDLSTLEWLTHAQEEAMDFVLYLERLKDEYNKPFTDRLMEEINKKQKAAIIELINMDSYSKQNVPNNGEKRSDKLKGCACYGSNSMHECQCKKG
jgi:hypothetical protein